MGKSCYDGERTTNFLVTKRSKSRKGSSTWIPGDEVKYELLTNKVSTRLPYGQDCLGIMYKLVFLGHRFVTDVLKLQFHLKPDEEMEPIWFVYSLAYAFYHPYACKYRFLFSFL